MKIAVVHDWLVTYAGSERVLEQILALYPDADVYSLIEFLPRNNRGFLLGRQVHTSFLQKMPFAEKKYRNYLPVMPFAIRCFDLSSYDLILSSSHAVAKGVTKRRDQLHVCYCHTPMRYAWDLREQYLRESGLDRGLKGMIANSLLNHLKKWDAATASGVDHFIANSYYIADRIKRTYLRESTVIYPPVDIERFTLEESKENFYLTASRMVPYKKIDLIVEAFASMRDRKLVVIGDGPDFEKIKAKASDNIEFLGFQPYNVLKRYMQKAKAFVFAAEEDFGIIPVEAQACGTPVIAFGKGGVLETVNGLQDNQDKNDIKKPTGLFFYEQCVESLKSAVLLFENSYNKFNGQEIRENAIRFSVDRFKRQLAEFIDSKIGERT